LKDLRYNNLYYSKGDGFIDPLIAENTAGATPGFSTSSKTRPLIIAKMEEMIRNQLVIVRSKRLFGEFKTFIWKNGRPQAMRSKHDDLVMSFAIACWIRDAVYEESAYDREKSEKMMNAFFTDKRELNTTIPGMIGHLPVIKSKQASEAKKQQQQYSWLYKG